MTLFRRVLLAVWLLLLAVVALLFAFNPRILFPSSYRIDDLMTCAALWLAVGAMSVVRAPESTLLQAAGAFRQLSTATLFAAVASVLAVFILVVVIGPIWSVGGVLLGQAVNAWITAAQARKWQLIQAEAGGAQLANAGQVSS